MRYLLKNCLAVPALFLVAGNPSLAETNPGLVSTHSSAHKPTLTMEADKTSAPSRLAADVHPSGSLASPSTRPSSRRIRVDQNRINSTSGRAATSGASSFSIDKGRVSPPTSPAAAPAASAKSAKNSKRRTATARHNCRWRVKNKKRSQNKDCLRKAPQLRSAKSKVAVKSSVRSVNTPRGSLTSVLIPPLPVSRASAIATADPKRNNQVLITTKGGPIDVAKIAAANGLRVVSQRTSGLLQLNIVLLGIDDGRPVGSVLAQLITTPQVQSAVPNNVYALQDGELEQVRFAPQIIKLNDVGGKLTGKDVRVAVIDTAIDETHPALDGAIATTFNGLPKMAVSQRRHGTAVAGLIAGRRMLRGAAPSAQLLIARAFDGPTSKKLSTDTFVLLTCLDWAVEQHASIINMSFAGPPNGLLERALTAAKNRDVILIAAAGNNGPLAGPAYPAAYSSTMAVTATDANNQIYSGANQGDYVFISAPGVDILAPIPGGAVELVSGTSFSAAIVSGIAALNVQRSPETSVGESFEHIGRSGKDLGARGRDSVFGHGLIDASLLMSL